MKDKTHALLLSGVGERWDKSQWRTISLALAAGLSSSLRQEIPWRSSRIGSDTPVFHAPA